MYDAPIHLMFYVCVNFIFLHLCSLCISAAAKYSHLQALHLHCLLGPAFLNVFEYFFTFYMCVNLYLYICALFVSLLKLNKVICKQCARGRVKLSHIF